MKSLIIILIVTFGCTASRVSTTVKNLPEDYHSYGKNVVILENIDSNTKHNQNILICETVLLKNDFDGKIVVLTKMSFALLVKSLHENIKYINKASINKGQTLLYINDNGVESDFLINCNTDSSEFFNNLASTNDASLNDIFKKYSNCP
jgi:hypothetical protein